MEPGQPKLTRDIFQPDPLPSVPPKEQYTPDPAKVANAIFQAGLDARGEGKPVEARPYPDESGEREQWEEGWHEPDQAEAEELAFA